MAEEKNSYLNYVTFFSQTLFDQVLEMYPKNFAQRLDSTRQGFGISFSMLFV